jgi:hypothetical protein
MRQFFGRLSSDTNNNEHQNQHLPEITEILILRRVGEIHLG